MFEQFKRSESAKLQQVLDMVKNLDPRQEVIIQKKKNYTWLIILASVVAAAGVSYCVYKFFFDSKEDFEDFEDEDYEDIDYDEDYDEEFEVSAESDSDEEE